MTMKQKGIHPPSERRLPHTAMRFAPWLVALASILPYLHTIAYPLVWDDAVFIEKNEAVRHFESVADFFVNPETLSSKSDYNHQIYRPLRTLAFALIHAAFGLNPLPYRLLNLALHVGCALLVFFMGRRLLTACGSAFVAALLFAVHPVHAEAVTWISSLADGLSTLLYLGATLVFLMERPFSKAIAVFLLLPLALLSKEMAITLPVVFLILHLWYSQGNEGHGRYGFLNDGGYIAAAFLIAGLYFAWRTHVLAAVGQTPVTLSSVCHALLKVHLIGYEYLRMLMLPHPLCSLRAPIGQSGVSGFTHAIALLAVGMLIAAVAAGVRSRRPAALLGLLFLVTLLPVMNLLPVVVDVAERFAYLPSVFFCLLTAHGMEAIGRLTPRRYLAHILTGLVVAVLAFKLVLTNFDWRSSEAVFLAQVRCEPLDPNAYWNLGNEAVRQGAFATALTAFSRLLAADPYRSKTLNNLAYVHLQLRRFGDAEALSKRSLASSPGDRMALTNLGAALIGKGAHQEAIPIFLQMVAKWPDYYQGHLNLGISSMAIGDFKTATPHLKKAREMRPDAPLPRKLLAQISSNGSRGSTVTTQH